MDNTDLQPGQPQIQGDADHVDNEDTAQVYRYLSAFAMNYSSLKPKHPNCPMLVDCSNTFFTFGLDYVFDEMKT